MSSMNPLQELISESLRCNDTEFANLLDNMTGSYAVEYVLEALIAKGNEHTIASTLELIRNSRK